MKQKFALLIVLLSLTGCFNAVKSTVKITNMAGNSGGTGSILHSEYGKSEILTNAHVCGVVKNGGMVHSEAGIFPVISFKVSKLHDLCRIVVATDLGINNSISKRPFQDHEAIMTAGHPHLLPTIISKGEVVGHQEIQIMIGTRACEQEDFSNPQLAPFCIFFGKLPIIRSYDALVTSALIQPGSSGSAVYGLDSTIAAVMFAGDGDLSYGLAVPGEYVYNFATNEMRTLEEEFPDTTLGFRSSRKETQELTLEFRKLCESLNETGIHNNICESLQQSNKINDLVVYN